MNTSDNKETTRTEIHTIGEFGLIDKVVKPFSIVNKSTLKGIGDDAAVIDNEGFKTVVSTDMLIEGIHFDLMYHPLKHLGYKAVVVNLSDIYAMNAIPKQIFVSIGISNRFSVEAVEELYWGIKKACERYGVDLAGGDTTSSPRGLVLSITAVGQGLQEKLVYRNGAKVGDLICVSGDFGENNYLIGRQLKPEARVDIIDLFDKNNIIPTSMMDISDGLASEVFHLCKQSNVGAFIEEEGVPLLIDTELQAIQFGLDPITCALSGGEDYELLFTVKPEDIDKIKFLTDIFIIGEIVPAEDGVTLHTKGGNRHAITAQGWTHFSS